MQSYLQQLMNLGAFFCDLLIPLLGSIVSVREIQQRRVLVLGSLKQRRFAPHSHDLLYLFHVVLGALQPTFQVVNHVTCLRDVLPDTCHATSSYPVTRNVPAAEKLNHCINLNSPEK